MGCAEPPCELLCPCLSVLPCYSFPQKKEESFPIRGSHLSVPKATFISSPASPSKFPGLGSLTRHPAPAPFSKTELRQETVGGGGQLNRTRSQPWGSTGAGTEWAPPAILSKAVATWGTDWQPQRGQGLRTRSCSSPVGLSPFLWGFAICEGPTGRSFQVLCLFLPAIWLRRVQ